MRRRRWKSRGGTASGRKKTFFLVLLVLTIFSLQTFIFVEKNLKGPLMNVAKMRIKQIATKAINKAITEKIAQGTNFEKLIDWKTDKSGKPTGFMLNYSEHMKIASETVNIVQDVMDKLQKVPEHIPIGQAMGSAILASYGPDVPIRFVPVGAAQIDLNTRQKDAGINMLLVEVYIKIMVEVAIIIPFDTEPEVVETEIPISYLLVVGDVPMYYFDNKGNQVGGEGSSPPSVTLPNVSATPPQETGGGAEANH
jgi:sporulation protein YunB